MADELIMDPHPDRDRESRIGRYRMLGLLAKGGMAEIYLALAGELSGFRTLAVVKRILPHLASNTDFIQMFFDEARIVAMLDHPNIVRIIEVGQDGDEYFLAMEVVQGKPLSALIRKAAKQNTPLTQAQSAHLVAQAANGLGYAHNLIDASGRALNVVHRDVSPQNILVSYEGGVKVIDFGVARALGRSSETRPGGLKGKIQYMAPEQAASGRVDRRSDVFSLGVVLWEAICGRKPFQRDTDLETLRAIAEEAIPPPSKFVRIPARLEGIVMRALEKNPADRFQTAQEMALALERYAFATQEFNPVQISVTMKGLFASDFSRWKRTVAAAKELEGEPEEWINTSDTFLRPQAIDLKTRGATVALHPVRTPPPVVVTTQELPSDHGSLATSSKVSWSYRRPPRRSRRALVLGMVALGVAALTLFLLTWSRSAVTLAMVRRSVGRVIPARVEALPQLAARAMSEPALAKAPAAAPAATHGPLIAVTLPRVAPQAVATSPAAPVEAPKDSGSAAEERATAENIAGSPAAAPSGVASVAAAPLAAAPRILTEADGSEGGKAPPLRSAAPTHRQLSDKSASRMSQKGN
ncbi:MAG: serine/threonine-protein kinase, partial [Myxococcales bacterium]